MSNIRERFIFMLAGMPASGSAELIQQDQQNLFGKYSEQAIAFSRGTEKRYHHFKNFKSKADNNPNFPWPEHITVHAEITTACSFNLKPYDLFRDEDFILKEFRNNLSGIFAHYSTRVINSIEPDWPVLVRRYFAHSHQASNVSLLYERRDEKTLECIFNAWNKYLAEINCYLLRTKWDNRGQTYRVIDPSHRTLTHADIPKLVTAAFAPQWWAQVKPRQ